MKLELKHSYGCLLSNGQYVSFYLIGYSEAHNTIRVESPPGSMNCTDLHSLLKAGCTAYWEIERPTKQKT